MVALGAGAVALAGCFTGARPVLEEAPQTVDDPNIMAVLDQLTATPGSFTAAYTILTRYGTIETSAAVVVDGAGARRAVTIGDVRFVTTGDGVEHTCAADDVSSCEDGLDAARVSDRQVTPQFWGSSAIARIRRDGNARIGASVATSKEFAGQDVVCVSIPVTGGSPEYCAVTGGPLAFQDGADVRIELTSYTTTIDESAFDVGS